VASADNLPVFNSHPVPRYSLQYGGQADQDHEDVLEAGHSAQDDAQTVHVLLVDSGVLRLASHRYTLLPPPFSQPHHFTNR
jgi:hypothetical protein